MTQHVDYVRWSLDNGKQVASRIGRLELVEGQITVSLVASGYAKLLKEIASRSIGASCGESRTISPTDDPEHFFDRLGHFYDPERNGYYGASFVHDDDTCLFSDADRVVFATAPLGRIPMGAH